jgi:hypothetical protein
MNPVQMAKYMRFLADQSVGFSDDHVREVLLAAAKLLDPLVGQAAMRAEVERFKAVYKERTGRNLMADLAERSK